MLEQTQLVNYLRSPTAIRERCGQLFNLAQQDKLQHFRCDLSQLQATAEFVIQVTQQHYPDGQIPFHSRWRHFEVGSPLRWQQLQLTLAQQDRLEQARIKFDLVIISVLLDAGAGDRWRYQEPMTGDWLGRSEGLAVASFWLFCQGLFSGVPTLPHQVDAQGLLNLTVERLGTGLQVRADNPLVGLEGRLQLLHQLGKMMLQSPQFFGEKLPRPGYLVDYLLTQAEASQLAASAILQTILVSLAEIWPRRTAWTGPNLGDVWRHPQIQGLSSTDQFVPFHKLSQWLTYSLLEPLQALGLEITDLDALTGLPEYRNGGLCLDLGLLKVKDPQILQQHHTPESLVIVEWRALTVCLLDQIATTIRETLNLDPVTLPLVKVLQGGTWTAGRQIAAQLRSPGLPPLQITSDATVF
jgi:hypothetical protein